MLDAIFAAVAELGKAANAIMARVWGSQTSEEHRYQARAEEAAAKKAEALTKMREAQRHGDLVQAAEYLSAANGWDSELKRVSDAAASSRAK